MSAHAIEARPVYTAATADQTHLLVAGFQAQYRGHTFAAIHCDLKHYLGWLMALDMPLLTVQRPHLELYLRHLETWISPKTRRPLRPSTIARMFGTVKLLYAHADPKMTIHYDMMANGFDRHAAHRVAGYLAGMAQ